MVFHPMKKLSLSVLDSQKMNINEVPDFFFNLSDQPIWQTDYSIMNRFHCILSCTPDPTTNFQFCLYKFSPILPPNRKTRTNTKALDTKFCCILIQFTIELLTTWFHQFPIWVFINVCIQSKLVLFFFLCHRILSKQSENI